MFGASLIIIVAVANYIPNYIALFYLLPLACLPVHPEMLANQIYSSWLDIHLETFSPVSPFDIRGLSRI